MRGFATKNRAGVVLKREQIWRRDVVAERDADLRARLTEIELGAGPDAALRAAVAEATRLRVDPTFEGQLHAFLFLRASLDLHARHGGLSVDEIANTFRRALAILSRHRVHPTRSRLASLHVELRDALARAWAREGRLVRATWERRAIADVDAVIELALLAGEAQAAAGLLVDAELSGADAMPLASLRVSRARVLRLSGDLVAAAAVLDDVAADPRVAWERACLEATRSASAEPLLAHLRRSRDRDPQRLISARLWTFAVAARPALAATPRAATLRRVAAVDPVTARYAVELDRCYDARVPLAARCDALRAALDEVVRVRDVEAQLLAWSSAARFLHRAKQRELAQLASAHYHAISMGTAGAADALGVAADLPVDGVLDELRTDTDLPTGLPRASRVAKLAVDLARVHAPQLARRWAEAPDRDERVVEIARIFALHLGRMRGLVMKLGQIAAFYGFDLPDEAEQALRVLHQSAPTIGGDTAVRLVESELGTSIDRAFARFEATPFAAGSIGQVHAAELLDGRAVAVKVQYPHLERSIRDDLRAIRLCAPFVRALFPAWDVRGIAEELAAQLHAECDFRREAEHQTYFRGRLGDEPRIAIPEVIDTHTTRRVLTSELVRGLPFYAFRDAATQAQRDLAGELVTRLVIRTTVCERFFNTDFHPGNFLFEGDRLWFVDFGNVRRWEPDQGRGFRTVLEAIVHEDVERFRAAFVELGLLPAAGEVDFARAFEFLLREGYLLRRLRSSTPSRVDRKEIRRDLAMWLADHPEARRAVLPPPYLFAFRAYFGSFALLAELGAELDWRTLILDILAAHDARYPPPYV